MPSFKFNGRQSTVDSKKYIRSVTFKGKSRKRVVEIFIRKLPGFFFKYKLNVLTKQTYLKSQTILRELLVVVFPPRGVG